MRTVIDGCMVKTNKMGRRENGSIGTRQTRKEDNPWGGWLEGLSTGGRWDKKTNKENWSRRGDNETNKMVITLMEEDLAID